MEKSLAFTMDFLLTLRETITIWSYPDRMILSLILKTIQSTFKYIISRRCIHLGGPNQVKPAISQVKNALERGSFRYVMRVDIKSYYASIQHDILISQVRRHFDDPRILRYLEDVITTAIDDGGDVFLPKEGIPRRSSLSPFFGALYLADLDRAMENRQGVFYIRFMDDIVILANTKSQYLRAKKRMFSILRDLKLKTSPHKTKMGSLTSFHYLGLQFEMSQNLQTKTQVVTTKIHPRTCRRALTKVNVLKSDAVDPAEIQRYLARWAAWWRRATSLAFIDLIHCWVVYTAALEPATAWLGSKFLFYAWHNSSLCGKI